MAKRDPDKTARNKAAGSLSRQMDALLPAVLEATGCSSQASLNAKIGGKHEMLVNVKERCFRTADEFASVYLDSLARELRKTPPYRRQDSAYYELAKWYQQSNAFRDYMDRFLERSFLTHYDEYSRVKPRPDAAYWLGENKADYGLLITPRFKNGDWENDKSEIRRLKADYYTIGHVLHSGLVVPGQEKRFAFHTIDEYLTFFHAVIVRKSGSAHQNEVARRYADFVRNAAHPNGVPLLIPELRYLGRDNNHKYRLDFCVIDPYTLQKIGFELSPWSTHGKLTGIRTKSQQEVNDEARANFEHEIKKCEAYFNQHGIHVIVFTDSDLADHETLFAQIARYLTPEKRPQQLHLTSKRQLLEMDLDAEIDDE